LRTSSIFLFIKQNNTTETIEIILAVLYNIVGETGGKDKLITYLFRTESCRVRKKATTFFI